MKQRLATLVIVATWMLTVSVPLFAHHGNASLDTDRMVTVNGTVTEYLWSNPHVFLKVDVKDASGEVRHWLIEAQNPVAQSNAGWSRATFKPGDEVTVDVTPTKNDAPIGRFRGRIVINGKVFKP
jgi:hypothetical protein